MGARIGAHFCFLRGSTNSQLVQKVTQCAWWRRVARIRLHFSRIQSCQCRWTRRVPDPVLPTELCNRTVTLLPLLCPIYLSAPITSVPFLTSSFISYCRRLLLLLLWSQILPRLVMAASLHTAALTGAPATVSCRRPGRVQLAQMESFQRCRCVLWYPCCVCFSSGSSSGHSDQAFLEQCR